LREFERSKIGSGFITRGVMKKEVRKTDLAGIGEWGGNMGREKAKRGGRTWRKNLGRTERTACVL
jgi:hypothetical protein